MRKAAPLVLCVVFGSGALAAPKEIVVPENAPPVVKFAAAEARRYVYVRTDKLLPIVEGKEATRDAIVMGSMMYVRASDPPQEAGDAPWDAARLDQEYVIKTASHRGHKLVVIAGSSDVAVLYAVYQYITTRNAWEPAIHAVFWHTFLS